VTLALTVALSVAIVYGMMLRLLAVSDGLSRTTPRPISRVSADPRGTPVGLHITAIVGPMFSAKTTTLARIISACGDPSRAVFKHRKDGRTSGSLSSHDATLSDTIQATPIRSLHEVAEYVDAQRTQWVYIDEIQWFERDDAASAIARMACYARPRNLVVAGLDLDFRGEEFPTTRLFMQRANDRICLLAVCACCGAPAPMSYLRAVVTGTEGPVGGADQYEPRCVECHAAGVTQKENS